MRQKPYTQSPKETARNSHDKHVQGGTLVGAEVLAGIRGDVEVRDVVAEEGSEGGDSEHEEEAVMEG